MKQKDHTLEIFDIVSEYCDDNNISTRDTFDILLRIAASYINVKADEEDLRIICRRFYEYCDDSVKLNKHYRGFRND